MRYKLHILIFLILFCGNSYAQFSQDKALTDILQSVSGKTFQINETSSSIQYKLNLSDAGNTLTVSSGETTIIYNNINWYKLKSVSLSPGNERNPEIGVIVLRFKTKVKLIYKGEEVETEEISLVLPKNSAKEFYEAAKKTIFLTYY